MGHRGWIHWHSNWTKGLCGSYIFWISPQSHPCSQGRSRDLSRYIPIAPSQAEASDIKQLKINRQMGRVWCVRPQFKPCLVELVVTTLNMNPRPVKDAWKQQSFLKLKGKTQTWIGILTDLTKTSSCVRHWLIQYYLSTYFLSYVCSLSHRSCTFYYSFYWGIIYILQNTAIISVQRDAF